MTEWHTYAHGRQTRAVAVLVFVSILLAWGWGLVQQRWLPTLPWWLDTPAVLGFYGIALTVYDRWAWRWLRGIHGVPDYSGEYDLTIKSAFDGLSTERAGKITIRQTWTQIVVRLETDTSTSVSCAGYLVEAPGAGFRLVYLYHNSPRGQAVATMVQHNGTAELLFNDDGTAATGSYYTGRGRLQHGEMAVRRATG